MEEWSKEKLFLLAGNIEKYPCLWKRSDPDYKKRSRRQYALSCISEVLNCSVEKIERKIKIILTQFFREIKKENIHVGSPSDRKYKSKWFLYPALEFLKDAGHFRETDYSENGDTLNAVIVSLDNPNTQKDVVEYGESSQYYENSSSGENLSAFENTVKEEENYECFENNIGSDSFHKVTNRKRSYNHTRLICLPRDINTVENIEQDECDIFGSFVATKMKKLNEINRSVVQMEISQILFNKEMEQKGMTVKETLSPKITLSSSD